MKKAFYLLSVFIIASSAIIAQDISKGPTKTNVVESPKLVVGIVVDQMRYDYLSRFSEKFTGGGFNKLLQEGYSCENNYLNYVPTNTAPGHASIYTGSTPSNHGILNNSWLDPRTNEVVYCVGDSQINPVGTGSKAGMKSPNRLLVKTLADYNRLHTKMKGKTISISLKDRAAVLSGGFNANGAYWFRGQGQGYWITSSFYMDKLPKWVMDFNNSKILDNYMGQWSSLLPLESYVESGPDDTEYERGFKGKNKPVFPYNLLQLAPYNGNYDIIRATPFGNSYTLDFAAAAIGGERLGQDTDTDLLLVSLSSTDYIGHNFGADSKEVEDAYLRLDQDLMKFLNVLDKEVGVDNYTLFLTSDHGANQVPHYLISQGLPGGYFKEATVKFELNYFLQTKYGDTQLIKNFLGNQVYLNHERIRSVNLKISEVENAVKDFLEATEGVKLALTRSELLENPFSEGIELMVQNGFHPERSGDVMYVLDPSVVVYAEKGSSHGSPYEFDTHVPLLFFGFGINEGKTTDKTYSINIAPTISELLNLPMPSTFTGTVIKGIVKKE